MKILHLLKALALTLLGTLIILPLIGIGLCIPFLNIYINGKYRIMVDK